MTKILLIKLGALGDVLRTTCLPAGLQKKWPGTSVTWVIAENARPLLVRHPGLSEVVSIESIQSLPSGIGGAPWDVLINLDEDPRATALAARIDASQKYGVGADAAGRLVPLTPASEHLIRLATDDRLKFRENQEPFQSLIYQAVGLTWSGEPYVYTPPPDVIDRQKTFFPEIQNPKSKIHPRPDLWSGTPGIPSGQNPKKIGLFVGASDRYANKFWTEPEIVEFCELRAADREPPILFLFGGISERERLDRLGKSLPGGTPPRVFVDTLDDLASVAAACDLLICGDTLVMHLGLAMQIPLMVFFGPTAHAEIPMDRAAGRKVVSPYSCGPCYLRACDIRPSCMSAIRPERVLRLIRENKFAF